MGLWVIVKVGIRVGANRSAARAHRRAGAVAPTSIRGRTANKSGKQAVTKD
jgi:hypothetical protein